MALTIGDTINRFSSTKFQNGRRSAFEYGKGIHHCSQVAIKAEAALIVAAARKDQEERVKAQEAAKNAKTPEELQDLINSRLKSSMAGRSSVVSQPPQALSQASPAATPIVGNAASVKAEAAAVVATAQRERSERIAAQKAVKTASNEEIQALIQARLSSRS